MLTVSKASATFPENSQWSRTIAPVNIHLRLVENLRWEGWSFAVGVCLIMGLGGDKGVAGVNFLS